MASFAFQRQGQVHLRRRGQGPLSRKKLVVLLSNGFALLVFGGWLVSFVQYAPDPTNTVNMAKTTAEVAADMSCIGIPSRDCLVRGVEKAKHFRPVSKNQPLEDTYITLWLHQVHRWFEPRKDGKDTKTLIREYLQQAQQAGFTSVMGDLPFEWTERDGEGKFDLLSYGKDWMSIACDLGLSLHVVVTMRDIPPWLAEQSTKSWFEQSHGLENGLDVSPMPSAYHPKMWEHMQRYTKAASQLLVETYGSCIKSISPTSNNEYETRYSQTRNAMRDYNPAAADLFHQWQVEKGFAKSLEDAQDPPILSVQQTCNATTDKLTWNWFGFREELLASRYETLCRLVHEHAVSKSDPRLSPNCLLHFGEFYSTNDFIMSNLFFRLATSKYVDEFVMDSNMALSGAPSSPSIVGILVSTANAYGKMVHYEAATERIVPCDDKGRISSAAISDWDSRGPLLLRKGIESALAAGVHSLGLTNLCVPSFAGEVFNFFKNPKSSHVETALPFQPTAVIFARYRAFFGWHWVISDVSCGSEPIPCWHPSFAQIRRFGFGLNANHPHMCPVDIAQDALIQVYDDLLTRHAQVAVVGDVHMLTDSMMKNAKERVLIKFPCLMDNEWLFYEGKTTQTLFQKKQEHYPFVDHLVDGLPPGRCEGL